MAKEDDHKDHVIHERKLRYYKKTIQLLTLGLEVFFLFLVAAIIFLFVASDDASTSSYQNENLLLENQQLSVQVKTLEDQLISASKTHSTSYVQDDIFVSDFSLDNGVSIQLRVEMSQVLLQVQKGYERRELIDDILLPLHTRYSQTAYDFALYASKNQKDIDDLKEYYATELVSLQSNAPQYLVLPLGATTKTVMDFRDFVDVAGLEDVKQLYAQRISDGEFVETLWKITSALSTYNGEIQETPRYPLETMLLGGGDCEDSAILFASLLKASGANWNISFLYTDLHNPAQPLNFNHVLVEVDTGSEEFIVETTSKEVMNPYVKVDGAHVPLY